MAQQQSGVSLPGAFGGLVRYNEEYESKFKLTPTQVMIFIGLIVLAVIFMKVFSA